MNPTHILAYTLRDPDYQEENCPDAIHDVWIVGSEAECREQYEAILSHPDLYCAAVARLEIGTDWWA